MKQESEPLTDQSKELRDAVTSVEESDFSKANDVRSDAFNAVALLKLCVLEAADALEWLEAQHIRDTDSFNIMKNVAEKAERELAEARARERLLNLGNQATARVAAERRVVEALPDDLRAQGWAVVVHHTFWAFSNDRAILEGEGLTDADALNEVRAALAAHQQESDREG